MINRVLFVTNIPRKRLPWLLLGGLLAFVLFLLYIAPEEATLGAGIRVVYVHVSLTWTGMVGLILAGVLGLVVLVTANEHLAWRMQTLSGVAFGFYVAGIVMSAVASQVNWGNVFWKEPRMAAALNSLAVITILLILNLWFPWVRVRGFLQAAIPAVMIWVIYGAPLVLHPANPIRSSEATSIQLTFIGFFLLFSAIAAWISWSLMKVR